MSDYPNRRYVTFNVIEKNDINYEQVFETNINTLRFSTDNNYSFVKYDLPTPTSVVNLKTKSKEYTHNEFIALLLTPEWIGDAKPIP